MTTQTETPPDLYAALDIPPTASQAQIREGYKKAALRHHPDRVPSDSPERGARTKKFQQINDAYYTLSDPTRRHNYDLARKQYQPKPKTKPAASSSTSEPEGADSDPEESMPQTPGGWSWSSFGYGGRSEADEEKFSDNQFGSAFEEMLREEGMAEGQDARPTGKFWGLVGGLSGAAMGFIVANFPGAIAGGVAGNRLGAVRDAHGKSVYAVFQELPQNEKAKLLSELAAKVFAQAVSG